MTYSLRRRLPGVLLLLALLIACQVGARLWSGSHTRLIERIAGEAPGLIAQLPDKDHPAEVMHWFKALAKAGYSREAQRMAASVQQPKMKSQALSAVATGLFEAQRFAQAAEVARSIPDPQVRDMTLRVVSIGLALSGGPGGQQVLPLIPPINSNGMKSVSTASEIKDASQRDSGLADSSRMLRLMNDDAAADAAQSRIAGAGERDESQASKAWTLALKGKPRAAIETAAKVQDPSRRVFALVSVAGLLADRGRETGDPRDPLVIDGEVIDRRMLVDRSIQAAERAVAEARDAEVDPSAAQACLAQVFSKARRFAEAREAAAEIEDPAQRAQSRAEMVRSMAEGGEPAEALKLAQTIPEPRARSDALTSVIEATAKRGTAAPSDVITAAAQAIFAAAEANEKPADRSEALQQASHALALAGQTSEALRAAKAALAAARDVAEQEARAYALSNAAGAWAHAEPGQMAADVAREALVASAPLGSPYWDDGPLQGAARALIKSLPTDDAIASAASIEDPLPRALALMALADIIGGYGWNEDVVPARRAAEQALQTAQAIPEPNARASTLVAAMEIAGRAGLTDQALAAAHSIPLSLSVQRSQAYQALAVLEAEHLRFDQALDISQTCTPGERLTVFATILDVHAERAERRRFARETTRRLLKNSRR